MSQGELKTISPTTNKIAQPAFSGDELRSMLAKYDRKPFMDILAVWMECAPTPQDIMAFAKKKPDLYVKAMGDLARMSGFTDKREMDINFNVNIAELSDSQLEDRIKRLQDELFGVQVIEGTLATPDQPSPKTPDVDLPIGQQMEFDLDQSQP